MRTFRGLLVALCLCAPAVALAGKGPGPNLPTLGETGLILLGVSLVGSGIAALRRRRR